MGNTENRALLEGVFAELAKGNSRPFVESWGDNVTWTVTGTTPWSGTYRGKDSVLKDLMGPLFANFAGRYVNTAKRIVVDGDMAVVECQGQVNTKSGKPYNNNYCYVFRFEGGKIVEIVDYLDTALVQSALEAPLRGSEWDIRVADLWRKADSLSPGDLVAAVDTLAAQRPADDPFALFERACARDTAGLEAEAEPLYRKALDSGGLDAYRRTRATIQLASTLRNLGRFDEARRLVEGEIERQSRPGEAKALNDEAHATLALICASQGRTAEAAAIALATLAPHLSRYRRSMSAYAKDLLPR